VVDPPDMARLIHVAKLVGAALPAEAPADDDIEQFLRDLLYGKREAWSCQREGLITELELRDLLLAHLATFLSRRGGIPEPDAGLWCSAAISLAMEQALYGRAAHRHLVDGDR
jgi:hypothetical protein